MLINLKYYFTSYLKNLEVYYKKCDDFILFFIFLTIFIFLKDINYLILLIPET